ncbi:MAG: AsmA family protein, partial [Proteobacteria bacterium]|nr:AsmA family protein [Pseudomonadota bacterium]
MANTGKSRFRTWSIIVGTGFLLLLFALLVPFIVDLSSFKPQIQELVEANLRAKVDFTSARLHLLPTIGVRLEKVSVENTDPEFNNTKLFAVDTLTVQVSVIALFTGRIVGNILIKAPEFTLARKGLKNNLAALSKPANKSPSEPAPREATTAPPPSPTPQPTSSELKSQVTSQAQTMATIKEKVLIETISIEGANVTIRDIGSAAAGTPAVATKDPVRLQDLNVKITNIGLDRDIAIAIDTKLDINEAGAVIKGPIKMNETLRVTMGGKGLEKATFSGKLSYDDLLIEFRDAFKKAPDIPLNIAFNGIFVPDDFTLQDLTLNFHNLKLESAAHVVDFKDPLLSATIKIANENLASLGDVLPKHREMLLNGQLHLDAGVEGKFSLLDTLAIRVLFDTKLTGTDLNVKLATTGVLPFKGKLDIKSQRIDLDGLLKPFLKPEGSSHDESAKAEISAAKGQNPTSQSANETRPTVGSAGPPPTPKKDFELSPELKALLAGTDGEIRVDLREVVFQNSAKGRGNLNDTPISFDGDFKMTDIHPEQVMLVIKPEHKDLLIGRMNLDLAVKGKGTTVPTLNKTLNGTGAFKFSEGQMNTPSLAAKIQEQFDKYVESLSVTGAGESIISLAKKLLDNPVAKAMGKTPPDIDKLKDQYRTLGSVKLGSKASASKDLKDVSGKIEIKEGKIYVSTVKTDSSGTMDVRSFVDLEMKLG